MNSTAKRPFPQRSATRPLTMLAVLVALLIGAGACGSTPDTSTPTSAPASSATTPDARPTATDCPPSSSDVALPDAAEVSGSIRVMAAASLTGAFDDLATAFEEAYPDTQVETSFGASSDLVAQLDQGSPADVLATADTSTMDDATEAGNVTTPAMFTCNTMTILTAPGNPLEIEHLDDLARSDVRFTLCAEPVPCGHLGREVLANAGVDAQPVGSEANVKAVVAKVTSGEVDAGIVYVTDAAAAADEASQVSIPEAVNVTTAYPIAVTGDADDPETAEVFSTFVRSAEGQEILASYGFGGG